VQQPRTADPTQGRLDAYQVGSRVARLLSGFDQDAQTRVRQATAHQRFCRLRVPNARLHAHALLVQELDHLERSGFMGVDRGKIW
jgi:hypothetical protein